MTTHTNRRYGAPALLPWEGMSPTHVDLEHYVHRFDPPEPGRSTGVTFLMLHGTGGDQHDLVPLARLLRPGAAVLAPRGDVLERGMPRFFRRRSDGVFDLDDLRRRTVALAEWTRLAIERYAIDPGKLVACGFSNGANIAASVLLTHSGVFAGAILLSPIVPFEPTTHVALAGTPVFIGAGRDDTMAPPAAAERLAALLRARGADVTLFLGAGAHGITPAELEAAREWLAARGWG